MATNFSTSLTGFYRRLRPPAALPAGIDVLWPQKDQTVSALTARFFSKYFNDSAPRRIIFGINPGRFGAGITGINFTAPDQLKNNCNIDHPFGSGSELSAEFIYEMIDAYGGPAVFYGDYFISAVCPLGFIRNGRNLNYYDDKNLQQLLIPFIRKCIRTQLRFGFLTDRCYCVGEDRNYRFLSQLNDDFQFFDRIIPLPHPRFIMQYRRRNKSDYIRQYLLALKGS